MNNAKKIICSVGIILISFILLVPFFCTLILSFQDYRPFAGLFGSVWVGLENISAFPSSLVFIRILSNTLTISILGTIIGAAYVLVSSLSIIAAKSQPVKGALAAVFAMPAVVPVNLLINALPTALLMEPSFLLQLTVSAIDGLRLAGLFVAVAYFIKNKAVKESIQCMLLFVAVRLILVLSTDLTVITGVQNPLTYEVLDVFASYTYRTGMQNGSYSPAAAVHLIKTALSVIPAVAACAILIKLSARREGNSISTRSGFSPVMITAVIPAAILIIVLITGGSLLPAGANEMVLGGYINEFAIAFVSALLVAAVSLGLAALARNSAGVVGIVFLALLCLTGNSVTGKYLLAHSLGLVNTFIGTVFYQFSSISVLSLILLFATQRECHIKTDMRALIIGFILMFARFWGDSSASLIMINNRDVMPLSVILRQMTMQANPADAPGVLFSTLPYILIPVCIVFAGFIISSFIERKQ